MSNGSLDFDFDMAGVDRAELLAKIPELYTWDHG